MVIFKHRTLKFKLQGVSEMKQREVHGFDKGSELILNLVDVLLNQMKETSTVTLAIAGGSCSGKSLLAHRLMTDLELVKIGSSIVSLDNYYKNRDHHDFPFNEANQAIFDLPQSYWFGEFCSDISNLISGSNIDGPIYDKKTHRRLVGQRLKIEANPVIIAEGLFAIQALVDLEYVIKIFVEANLDTRVTRRVKRDTGVLHDTEDDTLRFIVEQVQPYYEEFVAPQKAKSEIVIVND